MRKRNQKKKHRNREQKKVHEVQEKNQQEILEKADDVEQRRTTRLGAILAIVVVAGTLCAFLFRMTIHSLYVGTMMGVIYKCLQGFFFGALSVVVILFIDIVLYIINDLKRYNTSEQSYKQYDEKSDNSYRRLIDDFRIYVTMLLLMFFASSLIFTFYGEESQKKYGDALFVLYCLAGVILVMGYIKQKKKGEVARKVLQIIAKIAKCAFTGMFCFTIVVNFVVNNEATISVNYNSDGMVEICNTSIEDYGSLEIGIDNKDGENVYAESIGKEKILVAEESSYVSKEIKGKKVAEGILLNAERVHWKYLLNLEDVINEPGEYYVSIRVHQKGKNVVLSNSFWVEKKEYIFAKDSINKEY